MSGDPKIIAALAIAILALPPVVNAIMVKAAEQADVSWLRDAGLDPDIDFRPEHLPENIPPPEGFNPPPPTETPPPPLPPCQPETRGSPREIPPPVGGVAQPPGELTLETERGDLAITFAISGDAVSGRPSFRLFEDSIQRWQHQDTYVNQDLQLPAEGEETFANPPPGVVWLLEYDLGRTAHQGIRLELFAHGCAEGTGPNARPGGSEASP